MQLSNRELCLTALLTALITISGSLKIPSFVPGSEFQLSAPIAVAICGVFGIKRYLTAGIAASVLCLMLGTQNIFNVFIALSFRAVVACCSLLWGNSKLFYVLAGPLASAAARLLLSLFVGKAAIALIAAAVPGMIFTAFAAPLFAAVLNRAAFIKAYAKLPR